MPSLHTIDAALARCRTELACLLRAEEEPAEPSLAIQWMRQRKAWERHRADPSLVDLYHWAVQTPEPHTVIWYVLGLFCGHTEYRYMRLNFLDNDVSDSIANVFYWYYKKIICNKAWLDDRSSIEQGTLGDTRYVDARTQWYNTLTFKKHVIYFTWRRPSDLVLDVVFTTDPALYESNESWKELTKKCTDA
jgi:hypothetical protein